MATSRDEILTPAIDAGGGQTRPQSEVERAPGWWGGLRGRVLHTLSGAALEALELDSAEVAKSIQPASDDLEWPASRVRTGLVVGSVQSGKTAHMLALTARLFDCGVGLVIVLSGTSVALWLQTYERLLRDLDGTTEANAYKRNSERALIPSPNDILRSDSRVSPDQYVSRWKRPGKRLVIARKPLLLVLPKESFHLHAAAGFLESLLDAPTLEELAMPLHMVVLDDEADDASILREGEAGAEIPRAIERLWTPRGRSGATRDTRIRCTYVAYTATPQANFLQCDHNPLSPRDFTFALRVPGETGDLRARDATTFREPDGLARYYCGGSIFYDRAPGSAGLTIGREPLVRLEDESEDDWSRRLRDDRWDQIANALRAYFVSGAIRLLERNITLRWLADRDSISESETALLPPPHSMLVHSSARKDEHFRVAEEVARWSRAGIGDDPVNLEPLRDGSHRLQLDLTALAARLDWEEEAWKQWITRFQRTTDALRLRPHARFRDPSLIEWDDIRRCLIEEVFPSVRIRVLNSDPSADERPSFRALAAPVAGQKTPPSDIYSIFVAGNVLSRGLTLEGLCTSLFLRTSDDPAQDTQMQMQRWFGYRGGHLPYCRVFLSNRQYQLFSEYHENDEALKQQILEQVRTGRPSEAADVLVLRGECFKATAKVPAEQAPLWPGPTPAIRLIELHDDALVLNNVGVLSNLLDRLKWERLEHPPGTVRGLIATEPLRMTEVSDVLDQLRYSFHDPDLEHPLCRRWLALQEQLALPEPLFRPPALSSTRFEVSPTSCPYSIAAYLRLWDAALRVRSAKGLYATDVAGRRAPWSMIDHERYRRDQPQFFVAVRFGNEGVAHDPRLEARGIQAMRRSLELPNGKRLETLWGTRGREGSYFGDQLIDYHFHGASPVPSLHDGRAVRERGHPGLLLFHVIHQSEVRKDAIAIGLGIPLGGPDHIAALRSHGDSES